MNINKLASLVQKEMIGLGLNLPHQKDVVGVLTGLSLLVCSENDPDCEFSNKVNETLERVAKDIFL